MLGFLLIWHFSLVCYDEKKVRETGADRAGVIGLIQQKPDRDWVSSDQGSLSGRSGCDRPEKGQLR